MDFIFRYLEGIYLFNNDIRDLFLSYFDIYLVIIFRLLFLDDGRGIYFFFILIFN